jgi:hypothetical protein
MPGGVQRAAALARLHDHGAAGQRSDDPVTDQEPHPGWMLAGRPLADNQTIGRDSREQVRVACGIGEVDPAGQHRDRDSFRGQGATVRGGVHAVSPARDDGPAPLAEVGGEFPGQVAAVSGRGP